MSAIFGGMLLEANGKEFLRCLLVNTLGLDVLVNFIKEKNCSHT